MKYNQVLTKMRSYYFLKYIKIELIERDEVSSCLGVPA